jgi:hypothetical protein
MKISRLFNNLVIDNIEFSPEVVPEPDEFILIAFGAILFCLRQWQKSGTRSKLL